MRNASRTKIERIITLTGSLPYFSFDDLATVERNKTYLKILISRYEKAGKVVRLKKGLYATVKYIDEAKMSNTYSSYVEFLANILYPPSYLSLDYILYAHNLLTEIPVNYTSISKNKTAAFSNKIGNYIYHKIKDELFCGYKAEKISGFVILKATKAKALFDFLYLRKNLLTNKKAVEELRLNLGNFSKKDLKEFMGYVKKDGSKKMKAIFDYLFK